MYHFGETPPVTHESKPQLSKISEKKALLTTKIFLSLTTNPAFLRTAARGLSSSLLGYEPHDPPLISRVLLASGVISL